MPEFWVGTRHGEFGLEDFRDLCARFPEHSVRAVQSALKSEGFRLRQIIKTAIQMGGPAGAKWAPLHPHTLAIKAGAKREARWAAKVAKGGTIRKSTRQKYRGHIEIEPGSIKPLRKLAGAVRYFYDDTTKTVTIGFLDASKRELAKKHAEGYTRKVDRPMRKFLAAHGFFVREGTTIKVPPRPVVAPVFEAERGNILKNIGANVTNNIYRYLTGRGKDFEKRA